MKEKCLIKGRFTLQRFQAKGGWTYISLPGIKPAKGKAFGQLKVKGFIDDCEFEQYHLMPFGNGDLFLPVNGTIRKKTGKKEGDTVTLVLFEDNAPLKIPAELILVLEDEPKSYELFMKLAEGYRKEFISWIYAAKKEETRVARMAAMINKILQGQTLSKK